MRTFPTDPLQDHLSRKENGMALVITLALLVIVSGLMIAFFSQVTSNSLVEAGRSRRMEADVLGRAAANYVVEQFLQEIVDVKHSEHSTVSGKTVYLPLSGTNSIPLRQLNSGIDPKDAVFFNLIRQSVPETENNASGDSVATPDRSGRFVAASRWNLPKLLTGDGFTASKQLPHWIYTSATSVASNEANANTIGRFAYNVYDIGGLLNVNAAGCPGSLSGVISSLKGTQGGVDLTQLPGVTQADVNRLIDFRNPDATSSNYSNYLSAANASGWLSNVVTDGTTGAVFRNNYFFSRQDLLRYATTQNSNLIDALPYLTVFTRSVNAPSWMPPVTPPASTVNYAATAESSTAANRNVANVRFSAPGTITHYNDAGKSTTYAVSSGDPLIQRRFSLAKLAWLTPTGPKAGISGTAIQSCFGLKWDSDQDRWNYMGPTGNTVQGAIETLDQVAAEGREPNFLELLKAGILNGSLGLCGLQQTASGTGNAAFDSSKDLHILRIAANIINAGNLDNYPRILAMNYSNAIVEVAGQTDLPYLYCINLSSQFLMAGNMVSKLDVILVPVFINPNREHAGSGTDGPGSVSLDIVSGTLNSVSVNGKDTCSFVEFPYKNLASSGGAAALAPIKISKDQFAQFRNKPQPQTSTVALNRLGVLVPYMASEFQNIQAFRFYSYTNEAPGVLPAPLPAGNPVTAISPNGCIIRMTYQTPSGKTKTYYTFGGSESSSLTSTTGICNNHSLGFGANMWGESMVDLSASYILACQDARTGRLGPVLGWTRPKINSLPLNDAIMRYQPMPSPEVVDATPSYLGWWPQGGKSYNATPFGYYSNNPDPDELITGVLRPADGWLGDSANPYRQTSSATELNPSTPSRPFILQRAYRSVAELGSVFRDTPWKSLSFFDETSADGALLDLFSCADEPAITAGRIYLNGRQTLVKQALLGGAAQEPDGSSPLGSSTVQNLANAFSGPSGFAFDEGQATANLPANVSQLANFMSYAGVSNSGLDTIKYHRETVVRALADTSQTRTWNLLIDVVAQAGRFPTGVASPTGTDFVVGGEKRYWLSIAIDRFTGKIVDQRLEAVDE